MVAVRPALRDDLFVMRRLNAVTLKIIAHKNNEIDLVIRHRSIFHAERNFPLRKFPGALVPRSKKRDFIAACVVGHAYSARRRKQVVGDNEYAREYRKKGGDHQSDDEFVCEKHQ